MSWHGCKINAPGWNDPSSKVLAFTLGSFVKGEADIHVMLNMDYHDMAFETPLLQGKRSWHRFADTSLESPQDICESPAKAPKVQTQEYNVKAYSAVILISR